MSTTEKIQAQEEDLGTSYGDGLQFYLGGCVYQGGPLQ